MDRVITFAIFILFLGVFTQVTYGDENANKAENKIEKVERFPASIVNVKSDDLVNDSSARPTTMAIPKNIYRSIATQVSKTLVGSDSE